MQILNFTTVGLDQEVGTMVVGPYHTFAKTQNLEYGLPRTGIFAKRTWGWGQNNMGQLGPNPLVGSAVPIPSLLPRSTFPKIGFTWESGNKFPSCVFTYRAWDSGSSAPQTFRVPIAAGPQSITSLQLIVAQGVERNGHDGQAFLLYTNEATEGAEIAIQRSGYQVNLSSSPFVAQYLGYDESVKLIPPSGLVDEVSAQVGNNELVFSQWSGCVFISVELGNNRLRFAAAWLNGKSAANVTQYSPTIPDGTYTPSQLATAINNAIYSSTGLTNAVVLSSPNAGLDNPIAITLKYTGVKIFTTAADSFFTGNNSLGLPGGVDFPDPALYSGSRVPDEVSAAAGNNLFLYRYGANVFNVTIPAGIYNLSEVEAYISKGMVQNGQPSGVFRFSIDSESRVVLEITQPSFQALFSARSGVKYFNNTVGRYLGFLEMDLPCNPANIVPMLTEQDVISGQFVPTGPFCIAQFASPSSEAQASCSMYQNTSCGLTISTAGSIYRKAAANIRPLVSNFVVSGNCSFSGATGACVCAVSAPACKDGFGGTVLSDPTVPSFSTCACAARGFVWLLQATALWGVETPMNAVLRNGIYSSFLDLAAEIQWAVGQRLGTGSAPISLTANLSSLQLILVLFPDVPSGGYQINISASTVLTYLGFKGELFPNSYALSGQQYTFQADEQRPDLITGQISLAFPAHYLGEWVHKVAVGDEHTVVLTTDNRTCIGPRCCTFRCIALHDVSENIRSLLRIFF